MRYVASARQKWKREHRDQRVAAKRVRLGPDEHIISVEIMCFALASFYSSEDWLALAPFGRWLTFWRKLGLEVLWRNFARRAAIAYQLPVEYLIGPVTPQPMEIPAGLLFRQEYTYGV
jgi:hypothetical protein